MAGEIIHNLGNREIKWQPDFSATQDTDGKWEATHSFGCRTQDVVLVLPTKGSSCTMQGFQFMGYDSCTVKNIKGGFSLVTCKYVGSTATYDDEEPDVDAGSNEMSISTSTWSILYNPRYRNISDEDKQTLKFFLEGQLEFVDSVGENPYTEMSFKYRNIANTFKTVKLTDAKAIECATKINNGITDYIHAEQIFRHTEISNSPAPTSKMNAVGKITNNPYAPAVTDGRNWLYTGFNQTESGGAYTITFEWRLSDYGGWDEDLYKLGDD